MKKKDIILTIAIVLILLILVINTRAYIGYLLTLKYEEKELVVTLWVVRIIYVLCFIGLGFTVYALSGKTKNK
jgi:uncharacterized BrkB/YihY/UPF0761 family membrane protein